MQKLRKTVLGSPQNAKPDEHAKNQAEFGFAGDTEGTNAAIALSVTNAFLIQLKSTWQSPY